ncbi:membrane protein insertase YidC [Alloprevotella sp. OH1205_COT-284]|uniref:membrane protein insertase YidC n=1 Tax=Alloprevotella sp. OH1205_COT-284 TaxID=2491043 RepID=UPI000F5E55E6|nr:membrane protein insertase YidC [Alloprevotella sp. OH1205_COT-284]RRD80432.1 membrane protein insertase YidC [Alloprevotella sp. OH1205_COT-284]
MDKNTIIGFVLMAAVLFGFSYWSSQQTSTPAQTTQQNPIEKQHDAVQKKQAQLQMQQSIDSTSVFFNAKQPNTQAPIVLVNDKMEVIINNKGGQIARVNLSEYSSYAEYKAGGKAPLVLYNENDAEMKFFFDTKEENISTSDYYFVAENQTSNSVTMALVGKNGEKIAFDYMLTDDYIINMNVRTEGMQQLFSPRTKTFSIDWEDRVQQFEKGYYFENMYSTLTYKLHRGGTEKLSEQSTVEEKAEGNVDWLAFKNQYFSSCFISKQPLTDVQLKSEQLAENSGYLKHYTAKMEAGFDPSGKEPSQFQWYFGPNNFRLLQSMDKYKLTEHDTELQDLVYLGWPVIRWINRFFTIYVFDFLTGLNLPMWLVLVLITILLRVIVYAPTKKSFLSSAKMRVLKPKVDAINAKYPNKEDALKRQQEVMSLYSQYGSSPMGGCLPMLIQMPIWIAMFNFVPNAIEFRQQSFLWADDLSAYDDIISWGTEIWGLGNHISLFCILFCVANVLYSWMTMRQQKDSMAAAAPEQAAQMKMMQYMMYFLPVMFFFMFNKYSAGLNFYYFLSLAASALTMWYLRKTTDDAKLLEKLENYYQKNKNNPTKKGGGLAARMLALQEQQKAMLEQQQKARQNHK